MYNFVTQLLSDVREVLAARAQETGHNASSWLRAVWATGWRPTRFDVSGSTPRAVIFGPDGTPQRVVLHEQSTSFAWPEAMIHDYKEFCRNLGCGYGLVLRALILRAPDPPSPDTPQPEEHPDNRSEVIAIRVSMSEKAQIAAFAKTQELNTSTWARQVVLRAARARGDA